MYKALLKQCIIKYVVKHFNNKTFKNNHIINIKFV